VRLIQEGNRTARLLMVGESPGTNEAREGRPFIGGAGMVLNDVLGKVGIDRSDAFITNVGHIQPPGNAFEWFYKKENLHHFIAGVTQLKRDIEEIRPNVVVAFGAQPLRVLTGKIGIDKWRGSILESTLVKGIKTIATYHPAYCLRVWDYKAVLELDMVRVSDEMEFPEIILPKREYFLDPDMATRLQLIKEMCAAEWLSIDIENPETSDGRRAISCVGFSDRPDRVMVIPIRGPQDMLHVRELCASPAQKIFQNGAYDITVLEEYGVVVENFTWDTMLAQHSLYTECAGSDEEDKLGANKAKKKQAAIKKGLGFLASIYTKEPFWKDESKTATNQQEFWLYNGKDAAVTREIRDVQAQELSDFGVEEVFRHEQALLIPLMSMTRTGILVDKKVHAELMDKYTSEVVRLQAFLEMNVGGISNAKSPKQMQALLYEKLKLPVQYKKRKDGTKSVTADKDAINLLAEKYPHPVLLTILEIRERRDLIERYLNTAFDADGRMRCSYDPTGTRSGRLASRASIYGSGTNLQNQPEEIRRMYIADPGCVFVHRDYSQAEARVVAYEARCESMIQLFEDPTRDIHRENAARIFGIPSVDISDEQRYTAKRIVHAADYGMEAFKAAQVVNQAYRDTGIRISQAVAKKIIDGYFMLYPEIQSNYWREIEDQIRRDRMLVSCLGRKRLFFGRMDDKMIRDAYSYKPQSTVGDLCNRALVRCYWNIQIGRPELKAQMLLNVHDSLIMQAPREHALEVAYLMHDAMEIPLTIKGRTFYIPTDCKIGNNWGNRSKKNPEENPNGLIDLKKWAA
jgi:DNA polymerase-1